MAVYHHRMRTNIINSLRALSVTYFERMPLILSPEDFIAAFINPEHVEKLKDVEELVGRIGRDAFEASISTGPHNLRTRVFFGAKAPIILPRYVSRGLQPTCPDNVRAKIDHWAAERISAGFAFGDIHDGINYLNEVSQDVRAMAMMIPCLPLIMASISDDEEAKTTIKARKLANDKSFGKLPRLPREVRDRLREASSIVNSVTLLSEAQVPLPTKGQAAIYGNPGYPPGQTEPSIFCASDGSIPVEARTFL